MKTPDFLNALPSVNELLDDPRVRSVADQLSRSVATTRVRGYLEQLAAEAKRRGAAAAAEAEEVISSSLPESMRDLVGRVSRYLTQGDRWRVGAAVNATGRLRGGLWESTPLSDAAIERMVLASADFNATGSTGEKQFPGADAADALCRVSSAPAAAVFSSHTSAIWMGLASLVEATENSKQEVVIARGDLLTLDGGVRVAELIERAGLQPREVGAADGATVDDYAAALGEQTAAVFRIAHDAWPCESPRAATAELASLVRQHNVVLIEDAGAAPLLELPSDVPHVSAAKDALATAPVSATLAAGADLVIARGDGLIGGPTCGVVLGDAASIDRVRSAPLAMAVAISPPLSSALAATVEQLADTNRFWFDVPAWSLLTTPLENLQSRAERLATLLAAEEVIAAAEVVSISAAEAPATGLPIRLPTVGVAISPTSGDTEGFQKNLRGSESAIQTSAHSQEKLLIDLRTVFPRQDSLILETVASLRDLSTTG